LASEAEELRREFDETREELDAMAAEIASAQARMAEFARRDLQLGELRTMLDSARRRHARLDDRERALRVEFQSIIGDGRIPGRGHS
jgi:predicted RNase H-like nuclease (RuvC/YqgF family)